MEEADEEADDTEDGWEVRGDEWRDSARAELGEEEVDMFEQSDPRRRSRPRRLVLTLRSVTISLSHSRSSSLRTAPVCDGSGADSSCCRNESISGNGSGESGSVECMMGRKRNGGWDGMLTGVVGESDRSQGW